MSLNGIFDFIWRVLITVWNADLTVFFSWVGVILVVVAVYVVLRLALDYFDELTGGRQ